jgi:hypothetical protein
MSNDHGQRVHAEPDSTESAQGSAAQPGRRAYALIWVAAACMVGMMLALRLVALDSDPYSRLSWSSGLLTDEGFYIHNARNLVLFGTARTDAFNNMLIMPTLHFVQVAVFKVWGVGAVPARMISVVCGMLAVGALFAATRRAFGTTVAVYATMFLGLDHVNLLYNRMALMDTPGQMLLVFAFYAWVRGADSPRRDGIGSAWLFACGALLALAFVTRALAGIMIPAAVVAVWITARRSDAAPATDAGESGPDSAQAIHRGWGSLGLPLAAGLVGALAIYAVCWYLPHHVELARVNRYYLWRQLLPGSGQRLALNFGNAWFGDERGAAPFLMRHTPAQILLLFGWLLALWSRWRSSAGGAKSAAATDVRGAQAPCYSGSAVALIVAWLASAALFLSIASYSPSRYYVLFYPAVAIGAACGLAHIRAVCEAVFASRTVSCALGGYVAYHAALVGLHHATLGATALVGIAAVGGGAAAAGLRSAIARGPGVAGVVPFAAAGMFLCWAAVNAGYSADWLAHLRYHQRDAGRWLSANLQPGTVLIGGAAPGLCLDNGFVAIPVIPGLCNDQQPAAMARGRPAAVAILDGPERERWWQERHSELIAPQNRIALFSPIGRFQVGVYSVRGDGRAAHRLAGKVGEMPADAGGQERR